MQARLVDYKWILSHDDYDDVVVSWCCRQLIVDMLNCSETVGMTNDMMTDDKMSAHNNA